MSKTSGLLVVALGFVGSCGQSTEGRDFGDLMIIGDSITQGSAPYVLRTSTPIRDGGYSYRYALWKNLVDGKDAFDLIGSMNKNYGSDNTYPDYMGRSFDKDHEGRRFVA